MYKAVDRYIKSNNYIYLEFQQDDDPADFIYRQYQEFCKYCLTDVLEEYNHGHNL